MILLPKTLFVFRMLESISRSLRNQSVNIVRLCSHKCEYVIQYRIRKGHQLFLRYTQLWEDRILQEIFHRMRLQLQRHKKELLFGAAGVYAFDWEKDRIPMKKILQHAGEIDYIHKLMQKSLICSQCKKRKLIDVMINDNEYCDCQGSTKASIFDNWQPFIERKDLVVWRKKLNCGMFVYKVLGKYEDVYAEDFLHVQTDTNYRKQWDNTAMSLEIADTDPNPSSNSHIIYWEMSWPRLFANRDYVYNRRYHMDLETEVIIIVSESTLHPDYPLKVNNHRVSEYWSYMVIKPTKSFKECGIEFVLTYYDNPGVSIPSAITSWVAMNAMPEFLGKLRQATLEYAELRKYNEELTKMEKKDKTAMDIPDPGMEYPPGDMYMFYKDNYKDIDAKHEKPYENDKAPSRAVHENSPSTPDTNTEDPITSSTSSTTSHSWWCYLHPYYYFA